MIYQVNYSCNALWNESSALFDLTRMCQWDLVDFDRFPKFGIQIHRWETEAKNKNNRKSSQYDLLCAVISLLLLNMYDRIYANLVKPACTYTNVQVQV